MHRSTAITTGVQMGRLGAHGTASKAVWEVIGKGSQQTTRRPLARPGRRRPEGELDRLTTWVDWATDRYRMVHKVISSWSKHGALVAELSALRAFWEA
jgi:hypothetical protein